MVFDRMSVTVKDRIVAGYAWKGFLGAAMEMVARIQEDVERPDSVTLGPRYRVPTYALVKSMRLGSPWCPSAADVHSRCSTHSMGSRRVSPGEISLRC
ncbi:unnamed protein product [Urochloa humidicola]